MAAALELWHSSMVSSRPESSSPWLNSEVTSLILSEGARKKRVGGGLLFEERRKKAARGVLACQGAIRAEWVHIGMLHETPPLQ